MKKDTVSASSRETETRLNGLALMLKEVYIPAMETKKEITHHMGKFIGHIQTSVLQAYGNVTITVPEIPAGMSNEQVYADIPLLTSLQAAVVSPPLLTRAGRMDQENKGVHRSRRETRERTRPRHVFRRDRVLVSTLRKVQYAVPAALDGQSEEHPDCKLPPNLNVLI
jgi:hypothetical protein